MNSLFLFIGVIISIICISLYLYIVLKDTSRAPALGDGVALFLSGNGISAGAKVAYIGLFSIQGTSIEDESIYVILGGIAVTWVSAEAIYKTIYSG